MRKAFCWFGLVDDREAGPVGKELVEVLGGPAREDHDPPAGDAATLRELEHLPSAEERQLFDLKARALIAEGKTLPVSIPENARGEPRTPKKCYL